MPRAARGGRNSRSLKYEDAYLQGYADGREARLGIGAWIEFYNERRPHQAQGARVAEPAWSTLARRPHAHSAHISDRKDGSQLEDETRS